VALDEKDAAAAKTGEADVAVGAAYLSHDQYDKAVLALQRGIQKGGVKRADEAQISLGRALLKLGRREEAAQAFAAVPESSKLARVAKLWAIYASQDPAAAGA
jgi:TolA-binding protein